ncbi:MAG: hypothetical protein RLZZ436_1008, partial [Planctomycetota bacterium]
SLTLSQLYLKSNAQGRLLDDSDRMIDVNGYLINSDGAWVDEAGNLLPAGAQPVRGGAPVRLSGGSLNAGGLVRLTSVGGMNLAGQIGDLSVVGDKLVSGTAEIQVRGGGDTVINGRLQATETADIRSTANLQLNTAGAVIAENLVHLLGGTLQLTGYTGSADLVILSGVQTVDITGTAQSGRELRLHSGVSAGWSDARLLTTRPTAAELAGGSATVRASGVLDAKESIRIATGASFSLAADAVVSPNLSSVKTPIIVQREKTIDVVVGSREVNVGTQLVDQVTYVPTQVTEKVGTQTVRIGTQYHTMDVQLTQDAYYNGSTVREYFVEQVDYQNISRSWCSAPVVPWASYHVWPDGTVRNIVQSPATGGQPVPAPESTQTFAQLTDAQRSVILHFLGYKRLFNFGYSNTRTHQTVNGNASIIPWTPAWAGDSTLIMSFSAPGLSDKYVRIPEGARQDFLRVVSQGFASVTETVGQYRDRADVRYTQITSALTDAPPDVDDYDNQVIGWRVDAVSDGASPSGVRDGARQYEINDGRTINGAGGADLSLSHPGVPLWFGGSTWETANDLNGKRTTSQQGYLQDSASIVDGSLFQSRPDQQVGSRRIPDVYSFDPQETYGIDTQYGFNGIKAFTFKVLQSSAFVFGRLEITNPGPKALRDFESSFGITTDEGLRTFLLEGGGSGVYNDESTWNQMALEAIPARLPSYGYAPSDLAGIRGRVDRYVMAGKEFISIRVFGRNLYYADALVNIRETFNDYDFHWIGKWHTVTDRRDSFNYEWVTQEEDVFGTVPQYATVTKVIPTVQQIEQAVWTTEPVIQQQTILVTERIEQTGPVQTSATFANESLRSGSLITIEAGSDASFIGLTRTTTATGEILVSAGRDVLLDGARPVSAGADSLAAVADLRAGTRVDVSGGRNVTMKADAILRADDGNATTQTEVIRLTAGETLTVQSDAFGGHE